MKRLETIDENLALSLIAALTAKLGGTVALNTLDMAPDRELRLFHNDETGQYRVETNVKPRSPDAGKQIEGERE